MAEATKEAELRKLGMAELNETREQLGIPFEVGRTKKQLVGLILEAQAKLIEGELGLSGGPPFEPGEDPPDESDLSDPPETPADSERKQQTLIAVKARPEVCPWCGSPRRKILQSANLHSQSACFNVRGESRLIKGIVKRRCECLACGKRYKVTDVIRSARPEVLRARRPRVEILEPDA